MHQAYIYQIYYDAQTRASIDPGFIPLDNSANERPDWYEFWVIRRYLTTHSLEENAWYGFLSNKFRLKTGLSAGQLNDFIQHTSHNHDVVLINYCFDQIAYFLNPFEQAEYWHPGITRLSQDLVGQLGYDIELDRLVTHNNNFTFSNFIVAKPRYWRAWLEMANRLFDYIEHGDSKTAIQARAGTTYGSSSHYAPMKAFIQERLPCLIGTLQKFNYITIANFESFDIFNRIFIEDKNTRPALQTCNELKIRYAENHDDDYLKAFYTVRRLISIKPQ